MNDKERIADLETRLDRINKLIYATIGQPLWADRYFEIREICTSHLDVTREPIASESKP